MELPEKLPNETTSESSDANGEAICSCGATTHSAKSPDRCANGHLLRGNRAAAIVGQHGMQFWREQSNAREEIVKRLLRDAGFARVDDAPLILQLGIETIAESTVIKRMAYRRMVESGGPLSESGKPRRALAVWDRSAEMQMRDWRNHVDDYIAAIREHRQPQNDFEDKSVDELIAVSESFAAELRELKRFQSAVRDDQATERLPTLDTRPVSEPAFSRDPSPNSAEPQLAGGQFSEGSDLTPPEKSDSLPGSNGRPRTREATWGGASPPASDDAPVLYAYRHRVTEEDVRRCMADSGDLEAYRAGRISKAEAYRHTAAFIKNSMEFNQ